MNEKYILLLLIILLIIVIFINIDEKDNKIKTYYIIVPNRYFHMLSAGVCSFDTSDSKEQELIFKVDQKLTKHIDSIKEPIIKKHKELYGNEIEYRFIEIEEDFSTTEKKED